MENPYFYSSAVDDDSMFFGRRDIVDSLVADLSALTPQSVAIFGGRRSGKSSLLKKLGRVLNSGILAAGDRRFMPCILDLQEGRPLTSANDFYLWVLERLGEIWAVQRGRPPKEVVDDLRQLYCSQPGAAHAQCFVTAFQALCNRGDRFRLVILVDESEEILTVGWGADLRPNLRWLLSSSAVKTDVALVMAGSTQMYAQVTHRDSPLQNILRRQLMPPLAREEVLDLARQPNNSDLPQEVAEGVWQLSGGQPCLAQYLLCRLWRENSGDLKGATCEDLLEIGEEFNDETDHFSTWADAQGVEGNRIYHSIAECQEPLTKSEISKNTGCTGPVFERSFASLKYHGLVRCYVHESGCPGLSSKCRYATNGSLYRDWFREHGQGVPPPPPPPSPPQDKTNRYRSRWRTPQAQPEQGEGVMPANTAFKLQLSRTPAGLEVRSESQLMGQAREIVHPPPFRRLSAAAGAQERQRIGSELYQAAVVGKVRTALEAAHNEAKARQARLALQLRFDADAVDEARRPWELLHDGEQFLLLSDVDLTRYVMFSQAVVPVTVEPPLKVLMVAPAARDLQPLNCDAGRKMFRDLPNASMQELAPPTYRQLLRRLGPGQPAVHVFDFEGHGFVHEDGSGLCFETRDGAADFVKADALGVALSGSRIALAVLNACHGADVDGVTVFNGVAPALILAGVPAVIGMQGPISDEGANDFLEALYDGISHCVPLAEALAHARRFLYQGGEWHAPVLYLRSTDEAGRILIGCPDAAPAVPPPPPGLPVQQAGLTRIEVRMPN